MPEAASTLVIRPMPVPAFSAWTIEQTRLVLDEHEAGVFSGSAMLCDAMGRDDRIYPALRTRINAFTAKSGLPFTVEASEKGDRRRSKTIADLVFGSFWDWAPEWTLAHILSDAISLGAGVATIDWVPSTGGMAPRLRPLPAHNLRWDAFQKSWIYDTLDGGLVVTPGDGNWLLFTPSGESSPWMAAAVRALGLAYVMRGFTQRDWARYCERHGVPIITIKEPAHTNKRDDFYEALRNMGSTGVLRLPQTQQGGFEVSMLEPVDQSWGTFESFLARWDAAVAIVLLGQNLTTEVQGGSFAAASVHDRVRRDYLAADAQALSTCLREQLVRPWGRLNIANWNDDLCPFPVWDCDPPADLKARADTFNVLGDALTKITALKIPVDIEAVAEEYRLPLRAGARVPEFEGPDPNAPPPVPPPQALPPGVPPGEDGTAEDVTGATPAPRGPVGGEPPAALAALARAAAAPRGLVRGQMFVDDVADQSITAAVDAMRPDVKAVLEAIEGAETYEEIRARLKRVYHAMKPRELTRLIERAVLLSELGGRLSVLEDL